MALFAEIQSEDANRRFDVKSPVTLESIGQFQAAGSEEVKAAVERGRKAQREWAVRSFDERAEVLWRIVDGLVERQDEIVDLVIKETGKTLNEAISMEVLAPCMQISHYAKRAKKYLATTVKRPAGVMRFAKKVTLHYQPCLLYTSDAADE